jgi:enoyl-CoA hydratase
MSEEVQTELSEREGVATLTLNRVERRNALSRSLRDELVSRFDELGDNKAIRVVILTGHGPVFCAGFDKKEFEGGAMEQTFAEAVGYHHCIYNFPKPIVAAINGPALGGGCDLAAMCDMRLAAATATFGQPQVRFGAPAAYDLMREVMATGAAREMCLTGRMYSAEQALLTGLVNSIHEPSELMGAASEVAGAIAALPPGVAVAAKQQFRLHQTSLFES